MTARLQTETHTLLDRYPDIFHGAVQLSRLELGSGPLKILSFGCSLGLELETLTRYFPDAKLYGCDINDDMIAASRARMADRATVFKSSPEAMAEHGPFDMVFAMSVLCLYGPHERRIKKMLPFATFEGALEQIDGALRRPGLLVLYNTSYKARDVGILDGYVRVVHPAVPDNGYVHKHARTSDMAARRMDDETGYFDLVLPAEFLDEDFTDVFFLKSNTRTGRWAYSHRMSIAEIERMRPSVRVDHFVPPKGDRALRLQKTTALFHDEGGRRYRVTRASRRSVPSPGTYFHPPLVETWTESGFTHLEGDLVPL